MPPTHSLHLSIPPPPPPRSWTASTCLPSSPSSPSSTACPAPWCWRVRRSAAADGARKRHAGLRCHVAPGRAARNGSVFVCTGRQGAPPAECGACISLSLVHHAGFKGGVNQWAPMWDAGAGCCGGRALRCEGGVHLCSHALLCCCRPVSQYSPYAALRTTRLPLAAAVAASGGLAAWGKLLVAGGIFYHLYNQVGARLNVFWKFQDCWAQRCEGCWALQLLLFGAAVLRW